MTVLANRFLELTELLPRFEKKSGSQIQSAALMIAETFTSGNKVLICGNGGSAADSQHFAAEFVNSFSKSINRRGLPAIALTTDSSILTAISKGPHRRILEKYAGCFNNRAMRGGSLPSLHARGAAVDFDPDNNGNHVSWPTRATMPLEVMEEFAKEGWIAAGAFWGRDAMHFQATK